MDLTGSIKRAPKWAFITAGGVTIGAVGIHLYRNRATAASADSTASASTDPTTIGAPNTSLVSGSPVATVTPPVIIGDTGSGDNGSLSDMFATFGQSFDNLVNNLGTLSAGDQALASQAVSGNTDIATQAIANAGSAPAPAVQNPTPILVQVPTAGHPAPATPACPAAYPHRSARGCFKCQAEKGGKFTHIYQNGTKIAGNTVCA
jgi:cell division septation protein DedD